MPNQTLELTPGGAAVSGATIRIDSGRCAVVGGAAQLYVMHEQLPWWRMQTEPGEAARCRVDKDVACRKTSKDRGATRNPCKGLPEKCW